MSSFTWSCVFLLVCVACLIRDAACSDYCTCPEQRKIKNKIKNVLMDKKSSSHMVPSAYMDSLPRICPDIKEHRLPDGEHFNNACLCPDEKCTSDQFLLPANEKYKIPHGFTICLHGEGEQMGDTIRRDGFYDAWSTMQFSEILQTQETGIFVDIGANVGMFTLLAASLGREVYSVEPVRHTLQNLRTSVALNNFTKVTVFGVCIGEVATAAVMDPYHKSLGGSQVRTRKGEDEWSRNRKHTIPLLPIDMLPIGNRNDEPILLMKIDIEGFEGKAIKGGMETLRRVKYLTLEYSPDRYERLGCSGHEMLDVLTMDASKGGAGFTMIKSFRDRSPVDVEEWKRSSRGMGKAPHLVSNVYFMRSSMF